MPYEIVRSRTTASLALLWNIFPCSVILSDLDSEWPQQPVAVITMVTSEVPFPCFVSYFYSSSIVLTNTVAPNMNVKSHNWIESSKHIHFSDCQYIDQFKLNMESLNKQLWCVIITWTVSFVSQINDKNMSIIVLPLSFFLPLFLLNMSCDDTRTISEYSGKATKLVPQQWGDPLPLSKTAQSQKTSKPLLSNINHSSLKCSSTRKQNYFSDATKNLVSAWKFFTLRGIGKNKSSFDSSLSHRGSKAYLVKVIFHFLLWFTTQLIKMWGLILVLGSLWPYY